MTLLDTSVVSRFLDPEASRRWPGLYEDVQKLLEAGAAVSPLTFFEKRRGIEEMRLRGQNVSRKLVRFEMLYSELDVLTLDDVAWVTAAELWARGRAMKPAVVFSDADLLIAVTAARYGRALVTCDARLATNLERIAFPTPVILLASSVD